MNYFYAPESFRLAEILKVDLLAIEDDITDVVICAQKEADIETRFRQQLDIWQKYQFLFSEYRPGKIGFDMVEMSQLLADLEDSQMAVGSLKLNKYNKPFKAKIQVLDKQLSIIDEVTRQWV